MIIDALFAGKSISFEKKLASVGVDIVPKYTRDVGDRNRTSPVAFTGNKFEVRAVGASANTANSKTILALLMADSFAHISEVMKTMIAKGEKPKDAAVKVARDLIKQHQAVIFNGDGYSQEWRDEAKRRGLPNYTSTIDVLKAVRNEKNEALFEKFGVLSKEEFNAVINVDEENLAKQLEIEGQTMLNMANTMLIPAAIKHANTLSTATGDAVARRADEVNQLINQAIESADALGAKMDTFRELLHGGEMYKAAHFAHYEVRPAMALVREPLDKLELLVDKELWPIPTYEDMLFEEHA